GGLDDIEPLPTEAVALAREERVRSALDLRATAMIESALPDHMIRQTFNDSHDLWRHLKDTYGTRGPTFVYTKLIEALNFKIPDTADPSGQIAHLQALFSQIVDAGATLHESIQVMMFLNALPSRLEYVSSHILATKTKVADLKFEDARLRVVAAWRNPHAVANAAKFRQQGQGKPQWSQNKAPAGPSSGPKPQGQQQQGSNQSGSGTTSGSTGQNNDGEKKKCRR